MKNQFSGYMLILLAASLWGTLGVFYKYLNSYSHLSPVEIVFWRALYASIITIIIIIFRRKDELKIQRQNLSVFLAIGIFGIAGFFIVYIYAITTIGMGVASVLLYSAAVWVALFGFIFQGDRITKQKLIALILALSGIVLIAGIYNFRQFRLGSLGLIAGLGSGLGYAAYIILNKRASEFGYSTWTVNAYGLGIGVLVLLIFQEPSALSQTLATPSTSFWLLMLGIIPTLGGGLAFYAGLQRIPAVNASIVATFEPVVATTLGWLLFSEKLVPPQILGGILVISSIMLIQLPVKSFQAIFNFRRVDKE
jgi:DME family drug/metabolite transporter